MTLLGSGVHTIDSIELIACAERSRLPTKRLSRVWIGRKCRELSASGAAAYRYDSLQMRILSPELGHGSKTALLAIDRLLHIAELVKQLHYSQQLYLKLSGEIARYSLGMCHPCSR